MHTGATCYLSSISHKKSLLSEKAHAQSASGRAPHGQVPPGDFSAASLTLAGMCRGLKLVQLGCENSKPRHVRNLPLARPDREMSYGRYL